MLNVAIAVDSATDYGPQAVRIVAAACEEVIGEHRCPVASDLRPGDVAAWYAVVRPNDPGLSSVRIEFRDRTADGVLIEERALTFASRDSQQSRLASVGSVIAALVAAREGSLARQRSVRPRQRATPPETVAPDWTIEVAALASPTFGDGPYRLGGLGRANFGFYGPLFALIAVRYAAHPGNPSFSWYTLSAGAGTRIADRAASFNLEFSGELVFERTSIRAERGAEHQSVSQNGWGGRVGVGAVWATWRHCSIIFGVESSFVLPRIHVVLGERDSVSVPPASMGLWLGLRFRP